MQKLNFSEALGEILKHDKRFDRDAYQFVREGLDYTLKRLKRTQNRPRHVSGQELLDGLRRFALEQFGPMAKTVLTHWGVRRCEDFGDIVFNMVEQGILGKSEHDSPEDFKGGYDFHEAFVKPYVPSTRVTPRRSADKSGTARRALRAPHRGSGKEKLSSGSN